MADLKELKVKVISRFAMNILLINLRKESVYIMQEIYNNLNLQNNKGEIWKDIKDYEGIYQVSNLGRVKSLEKVVNNRKYPEKIMKQTLSEDYLRVTLYKNSKRNTKQVHRLVAEAFIPNPENKPQIDHKDANKTNNFVSNLRWCSQKENLDNPITKEKQRKAASELGKKIWKKNLITNGTANRRKVLCIQTGEIFNSTAEAVRFYNIKNISAVSSAANPNSKTRYAGKLKDGTKLEWKYLDE